MRCGGTSVCYDNQLRGVISRDLFINSLSFVSVVVRVVVVIDSLSVFLAPFLRLCASNYGKIQL